MKKKSILNRPMFRQIKSPAYGTGISANLVNNEERQRYNYGGRVRAVDGLPYNILQGYPVDKSYSDIVKTTDPMQLNYWDSYSEGPSLGWLLEGEQIEKEKIAKEIEEGKEKSPIHPSQIWDDEIKNTKNWKQEYLGGDPVGEIIKKKSEVVEDTNTIGLTEDEKNALLSTGAFSGAAAAASSKGKDWKDVLSDAMGGVASGLGTGVNPAKLIQERKEQEAKYGAATDMYRTLAEESAAREGTPEALYTRLVEKGNDPLTAMSSTYGGANIKVIPKADPKRKDSDKMRSAALLELKEGDVYFDETVGWKIKGPGDESETLTITEVHKVLQKKG